MFKCIEHCWPRSAPYAMTSSVGRVEYQFCNECLAMKIVFSTDVRNSMGEWEIVSEVKIVEPS